MRGFSARENLADWKIQGAAVKRIGDRVQLTPEPSGSMGLKSIGQTVDADYCASPILALRASGNIQAELIWQREADTNVYRVRRAWTQIHNGQRLDVAFPELPFQVGWTGRVVSLEWRVDSGGKPVTLDAAGAPAANTLKLAGMLWQQWWWRDPIESHTINTVRAPHVLGHSPEALLISAAGFAAAAYLALAVRRGWRLRGSVVGGIVAAAWLANDARWMAGQQRQLTADAARFGGVARVYEDAAVFTPAIAAMAAMARETLPVGSTYAVMGGDLTLGDRRLRYLLAPKRIQVNQDPLQPQVPPEEAEYILVLDARLAAPDPATGRFRVNACGKELFERVRAGEGGMMILRRELR